MEIPLDSHEFVHNFWWPVADRAPGIGIWLLLLETMAHLSVVVNVSKGQRRGGNARSGEYGDRRLKRRRLGNREMEAEAGRNQGQRLGSRGRG